MRLLSTAVQNQLASGDVVLVQLVSIAFPGGVVALNMSNWNLLWDGVTYLGAAGLGTISAVTDKPGEVQGITMELNGGDPLRIALALDSADEVQGSVVTIRTAIMSSTTYTILDAPIDWIGKCDTMTIVEDGASASIAVTVESSAMDLLRGNPSTYSDADQQAVYPGDLAFNLVVSQVDKPVVWPAKEYYFK